MKGLVWAEAQGLNPDSMALPVYAAPVRFRINNELKRERDMVTTVFLKSDTLLTFKENHFTSTSATVPVAVQPWRDRPRTGWSPDVGPGRGQIF